LSQRFCLGGRGFSPDIQDSLKRALFQDFLDRFIIGTDQHYPEPRDSEQRWQAVLLVFNQLPGDLRRKIGIENAMRIYRLKSAAPANPVPGPGKN
jgi:hypothetical protein